MNSKIDSPVGTSIKVSGLLTLLLAAALALPAAVSAETYVVEACTPGNPSGEAVVDPFFSLDSNLVFSPCGNAFDGGIRVGGGATDGRNGPLLGTSGWKIEAPPNTTIREVQFERNFAFAGPSNGLAWVVLQGNSVLERVDVGTTPPASGAVTFPVNAQRMSGFMFCPSQTTGCRGGIGSSALVTSKNFFIRMGDLIEPTISATPPSPTTPLRGTVEIPYEAQDVGSGVAAVFLSLDFVPGRSGQIIGESRDDNGGKCREPFKDLLPCKLQVSRSIAFDATKVANGPHTITLVVADSAANLTPTASFPVMIDNPPPPSPPRPGNGPGSGESPNRGGALRPETKIAKHPPKRTSSRRAKFTFSSDKSSAGFECKLDRRPFKVCRSPFKAKVRPGRHSFQVRARDAAGNADLSPAVFRWRVAEAG